MLFQQANPFVDEEAEDEDESEDENEGHEESSADDEVDDDVDQRNVKDGNDCLDESLNQYLETKNQEAVSIGTLDFQMLIDLLQNMNFYAIIVNLYVVLFSGLSLILN